MRPIYILAKISWFFMGIFTFTVGSALIIQAGVGAGTWDVFHLGVMQQTGIPLSAAVQSVGFAIIALNWWMGIKPTVGMFMNMVSVGPILAFNLELLPAIEGLALQWTALLVGTLITGIGLALYTSADLGAGPRDGMMIGLTRRVGLPIGVVKNAIDFTICLIGWLMGGPVGLGTIVVAVLLGPCVQLGMATMRRLMHLPGLNTFVRPPEMGKSA